MTRTISFTLNASRSALAARITRAAPLSIPCWLSSIPDVARVPGLLETIRVGWLDIAHLPLSAAERAGIRANIQHVGSELTEIVHRLNRAEQADDGLPTGHRHG
jgi:hypothetical protein